MQLVRENRVTPGTVISTEHMRFQRVREMPGQVAVLGQHPGCQGKHELEARRPWLDTLHLHRQPGPGVALIHLAIMPVRVPVRTPHDRVFSAVRFTGEGAAAGRRAGRILVSP